MDNQSPFLVCIQDDEEGLQFYCPPISLRIYPDVSFGNLHREPYFKVSKRVNSLPEQIARISMVTGDYYSESDLFGESIILPDYIVDKINEIMNFDSPDPMYLNFNIWELSLIYYANMSGLDIDEVLNKYPKIKINPANSPKLAKKIDWEEYDDKEDEYLEEEVNFIARKLDTVTDKSNGCELYSVAMDMNTKEKYAIVIKNGLCNKRSFSLNPNPIYCRISLENPKYLVSDEYLTEDEKRWFIDRLKANFHLIKDIFNDNLDSHDIDGAEPFEDSAQLPDYTSLPVKGE